MPIMMCQKEGKPGYKWGKEGRCYTYNRRNAREKKF